MEHGVIIERLSHHVSTVKNITDGISDRQAGWKPSQEEWSVLEIINHMVDEERKERKFFVSWLKELDSPDWKSTGRHPKLGPMSAELLLANWLAHDLLHIRQIVGVQWAYLAFMVDPLLLDYAGNL